MILDIAGRDLRKMIVFWGSIPYKDVINKNYHCANRWSYDHLISTIGFAILVRWNFHIGSATLVLVAIMSRPWDWLQIACQRARSAASHCGGENEDSSARTWFSIMIWRISLKSILNWNIRAFFTQKTQSYGYRNLGYKHKAVWWLSQVYNGIPVPIRWCLLSE